MAALRRWRTREMVRIAWRDLAGFATISETLLEQSAFAQSAIHQAHQHARRILTQRHGVPRSAAGVAQELIVVGMGKLGGGELNFSSDIDLVFLFPEHGETDGARPLANEDFFTRLGQLLIRLLETRTARGLSVPGGYAAAALRRQRRAGGQLRRLRGLPAGTGSRLGALCLGQGAAHDRRRPTMRASMTVPCGPLSIGGIWTTACLKACAR